jgi:energy-coupling factor transport system permease protein
MNTPRPVATLHPVAAILYVAILFALSMLWNNPLWLGALLGMVVVMLHAVSTGGEWKRMLLYAFALSLSCVVVNAFLSHSGETVLWEGPSLPVLGRLGVTAEALLFGATAGLKIILSVAVFFLCGELLCRDDALALLSRIAPRSTLTAALAALLIPRMRRDLSRIREVMMLRGALPEPHGMTGRIRGARPMLHVLLLSSLEGAWDIAAALSCRAFGSGSRSVYAHHEWRARDRIVAMASGGALAISLAGLLCGSGSCAFYPRFNFSSCLVGIPLLAAVVILLSLGLLARSANQCTSSR